MNTCIIFDVDGTLIDTEKAVYASYQKIIFEEHGRYFTPEEFAVGYGVPTPVSLARYGIKNVEEAERKHHENLKEAFCDNQPFDGIQKMLEVLHSMDIVTGIVTSRNKDEIDIDPCLKGLMKYLQFAVCSNDTQKHKPEAEPLLKVMQMAGAEPSQTIYIGDTVFDYMCAKNAGVRFGLALWGAKHIENIQADYNLKNPEEILKLVSAE